VESGGRLKKKHVADVSRVQGPPRASTLTIPAAAADWRGQPMTPSMKSIGAFGVVVPRCGRGWANSVPFLSRLEQFSARGHAGLLQLLQKSLLPP